MVELDDFSFRLIFDEIGKIFTFYRDGLALYGSICCLRKAVSYTSSVIRCVRLHWYAKRYPVNVLSYGKWAVITGCTEGIGKAFAQELAHHGMNIIMLSKPMNGDLDRVAQDIRDQFHVEVETHALDFSKTHMYAQIEKDLSGKEIGILVNNVGVTYSYPMMFLDVPEEKLWHLINVNITAATMMTSIVLPSMVKRRKGAIINMSSLSSSRPAPYMTVYAATKAYIDHFSRALHYEYKSKGIHVQSLTPFYVATRMTAFSRTLQNHSFYIPAASDYVKCALTTLGYADRTTGYWPHTLLFWLVNQLSDSGWLWLSTRLNLALRRQAQRSRHRSGDLRSRHRSGGSTSRRSESFTSLTDVANSPQRRRSSAEERRTSLPDSGDSPLRFTDRRESGEFDVQRRVPSNSDSPARSPGIDETIAEASS